ncbi:hypothetical protein [Nostoc sp.]|uniref:hypothetical protein n=1 Tax=Nostoc sp. TaxID=1180 RepID=UPI002FF7E642
MTSGDTVLGLFDDTGIRTLLETNNDSGGSNSSLIISSSQSTRKQAPVNSRVFN